ncbi:MAG: heme-binding protein [Ramlibacter sp.]
MKTLTIAMILTAALASGCAIAQTPPAAGLVTERSISLAAAMELATASLERCRANGFKVTVTVLNRHTHALVVLSDDGVNPHTIENSFRKAYTAFTTRSSTAEMAKRQQPALASFMLLEHISALEGGLPIWAANKELVGAIGISGAPGGDKDAACAQVGLDKIARML